MKNCLMKCLYDRNVYLCITMYNYLYLNLTCKKTLNQSNNLTRFLVNPLCNSLYCQVDFEYSNKQKKHDIIHIGF